MKKDKVMDRRGFLKMGMKAGGGMLALSAIPIQLLADDKVTEDEALALDPSPMGFGVCLARLPVFHLFDAIEMLDSILIRLALARRRFFCVSEVALDTM